MATLYKIHPRNIAHVLLEIDRDKGLLSETLALAERATARGDDALADIQGDRCQMLDEQIEALQQEADAMIKATLGVAFDDLQRRMA